VAASAKGEGRGEKSGLEEHPLVAALVPDPNGGPPDSTVLHGYLGKSTRPETWRLYLDATLGAYVELPEGEILHHQALPDDAGTLVWLPRALELEVTKVSSTTIQAEFLSGVIAAGRMKGAAQPTAGSNARIVASVGCPSIFTACISRILACPSDGCPTWSNCPPDPTETGWCGPSQFAPLCTIAKF